MRTIKDPKKKPESRRRADMLEEQEEDDLSTKSTPPKKRKTTKPVKDDNSSLNDSGSFVDNQSDIVSEKSSVIGDNDASDISSLKSTPPKKRNYNRIINKSPEMNGESTVDSEVLPEKKVKPKKKVGTPEQSSPNENAATQSTEKKSPKSKKKLLKQPNDGGLNDMSEVKKKISPKKKLNKINTEGQDVTPLKKKPGRKRKLSGLQTEGKETEDNSEVIKSEKKVKKTKKQLQKEAQTELKRQTEELRKSQAEKSNNVEKLGNVENNEIKEQSKKTSKKKPTLSEKHNSDDEEETLNENNKMDHLRHNSVHMDLDSESPDDSDESSDLDTSFESINSERRENMETTMQDDQKDQNEDNELSENKINLSIKCEQCGYVSRSKGGHTRHMRKCQPEKLGLEPDSSKPKFHQCEQCEYTAPKRVLVINHMRSHGIFQCKRCTFRADSEDNLEEHSALEHKDRSDCKFCKNCNRYVKCSEIPLEKHMEDCQGRIPFKCPECSKEFQYESSLKCHVVSHYPDQPKLFSCNQCNYKSNYKANLKKHIRHIHEHRGERTVKCTECDKLFYTEDNMKRHLKLHSEERPHRCEQENCGKSFKTINGLKFHVLSHQTDRPFPCDIEGCLKSFKTSRALGVHLNETHQQSPKNYKCEEEGCEMAFYKKCHLDRHTDAHKDNRTHFCEYILCTKAFRTAEALKVHSLVHTGEKPLKCQHCDYTCRQKSSIKFHMKKKHLELVLEDPASPKPSVTSTETTAATDIYADSINKSDGDTDRLLTENPNTVTKCDALSSHTRKQNHVILDNEDLKNDIENCFLENKTYLSSTPKKSELKRENPADGSLNLSQDHTVPFNKEHVKTPNSTNQDHPSSHTVTTSTNDLQQFSQEAATAVSPKKTKKTDMYEFQSEEDSGDEMRPGLLRKDYDKDKPPLPPIDAKLLSDLRNNTTDEKQEPDQEKTQKVRKKPGPKPKPKPEKIETEEVKVPKKRGRKKKSELEKVLKVKEGENDDEDKTETNVEKRKPGKRGRGRSPKAKKEEKGKDMDDDDDDDDDDVPRPQPKRGRPPKKKPKEDKEDQSSEKVPKKRGRKRKVDKEAELKKAQEIIPENGDATINYSEVESNELFGDSTKDSMPDTNEMVQEHDHLQEIHKEEETSPIKNDFEEENSAFKIKTGALENKTEEKKSESESSDIGSDFDEDLKPPPAPRPPPMYDSEDGDIESGPENEEINGSAMSNEPLRDFESSRDISREISREISRDFESSREIDDSVKTSEYINSVETATPKDTAVHSVGTPGSVKPYNRNDSVTNEHENPLSHQSSIAHTPSHNSVPPTPTANQEFHESRSIEPPPVDRIGKHSVQGQTNEENTDESSMPEVDKDYVGRFFEEMQYNQSDTQISRMSSLDENTKSQDKMAETPRSDSGIPSSLASNQTEGSIQMQSPPADLSHKRIDLISPERVPDPYIPRSESVHNRSSERIPSVPSYDPQYTSNPLDPYSSPLPSRETILRQPEQNKSVSPPVTSAPFMRFPESEAMLQRQRMTTPYDRNLQNLHRIAEGPIPHNNSSSPLLRHVPGREEMFSGSAAGVAGSMPRNPFHTSWTGQDVRPPTWGHPTYLQQQSGSASSSLFGKDSYLPGREFMFDPSRAAAERNMFSTLSSAHSQRPEIPHDTFQFDRFDLGSYLSSHGYNAAPSLPVDYTRSAHSSSQKSLDERYRQPTSGVTDFRSLPPSSSASDMFAVNSSFNFEKFYSRDPMYHSQHIADNANNPFLPGVPSQHSMFGRDYPHRSFYTQNSPYPFMNMNDKNYASASAKLGHTSDGVAPQRDLVPVPRPNMTGTDGQLQDPYRHHSSMLYNMMNKYF